MTDQKELLNTCGCCSGSENPTPASIKNRPGLSALVYRVGTHGQFKTAMKNELSRHKALEGLTVREDDDFSIALLDAWSVTADVLTFYQERIANEGFLRTAAQRLSVLQLARLIGYELSPGVAASTCLAFTVEDSANILSPAVSAGAGAQIPGKAEPIIIDSGTKVQSIPGQDELPQTFETINKIKVKSAWNVLKPRMTELLLPAPGDTTVYLKGTSTDLKQGDILLFIGKEREDDHKSDKWALRKVKTVDTIFPPKPGVDPEAGYTKVTLDNALGTETPVDDPKIYNFRQQAALFGNNAPDWRAMPNSLKAGYLGLDPEDTVPGYYDEWPDFNLTSLSDPPPNSATGSGLYAEYYNNYFLSGIKYTRTDEQPIFYWDNEFPHPNIVSENFSVRWTGWIQPNVSGVHTFYTYSKDGARLWINGQLIIDNWIHPEVQDDGTIILEAACKYDIKLEYCGKYGQAFIVLLWTPPGLDIGNIVDIPKSQLYPRDVYTVHLDAMYKKILPGSWLVLSIPEAQELYSVESAAEDSRTNFTLNAKTTRLTLIGQRLRELFNDKLRETIVYAQSENMKIAETPITDPVSGKKIVLDSVIDGLEKGRKLIITGKRVRARIAHIVYLFSIDKPVHILQFEPGEELVVMEPPTRVEGNMDINKWHLKGSPEVEGKKLEIEGYVTASNGMIIFTSAREEDETISELIELSHLEAEDDNHTKLVLKKPLQNIYDRATVTILGNVASATHGETVTEVLGSGDATQAFQRFALRQPPLTYISAATPTGVESTLEIRVNDLLWKEVPSFYGHGPDERIYITRNNNQGKTHVRFGDGKTGSRVPTGQENITAAFRKGIGLEGMVKAGQLSLLMARPYGVKEAHNPLAPSGAADPEKLEQARQNCPLTVLTLDRVVSLRDFEDFARAFAGIKKARADWVWKGETRKVYLTIAAEKGITVDENSMLYRSLVDAVKNAGNGCQPFCIESYTPLTFNLKAKIHIDSRFIKEKVINQVKTTLNQVYSFEQRQLAQPVTKSEVLAVIQGIEGVEAVDLDELYIVDSNGQGSVEPYLSASPAHWDPDMNEAVPAQMLTLEPGGIIISLMEMVQ